MNSEDSDRYGGLHDRETTLGMFEGKVLNAKKPFSFMKGFVRNKADQKSLSWAALPGETTKKVL
jgi:hypothetical protein